jgi:putative membrane protein
MSLSDLPAINAGLNSLSALFLSFGYYFIRRRNRAAHRNCMVAAFVTSTLFLTSYVFYHLNAGRTVFLEPPWFRPIYLTLLFTHTILAVIIVPLILTTLYLAARKRFEMHKKVARWTWPSWMYVSVTGVIIYLLLYQIFPQLPPR